MKFWGCCKISRIGQIYNDLSNYQMANYGYKLEEPKDMRPDVTIDCPNYDEEHEMEIDREMRIPTRHKRRPK